MLATKKIFKIICFALQTSYCSNTLSLSSPKQPEVFLNKLSNILILSKGIQFGFEIKIRKKRNILNPMKYWEI
jgi:hypothetical protein